MLVMRTIKDPPDSVSGFTAGTYAALCELTQSGYIIPEMERVQITSQVERTEPDELDCPKQYTYDLECHGHSTPKGWDSTSNSGEHTPVEGEGSKCMEADMERDVECTDDGGTMDTGPVAATTGDNDQEDTSERDELDIQFVRVITT